MNLMNICKIIAQTILKLAVPTLKWPLYTPGRHPWLHHCQELLRVLSPVQCLLHQWSSRIPCHDGRLEPGGVTSGGKHSMEIPESYKIAIVGEIFLEFQVETKVLSHCSITRILLRAYYVQDRRHIYLEISSPRYLSPPAPNVLFGIQYVSLSSND